MEYFVESLAAVSSGTKYSVAVNTTTQRVVKCGADPDFCHVNDMNMRQQWTAVDKSSVDGMQFMYIGNDFDTEDGKWSVGVDGIQFRQSNSTDSYFSSWECTCAADL